MESEEWMRLCAPPPEFLIKDTNDQVSVKVRHAFFIYMEPALSPDAKPAGQVSPIHVVGVVRGNEGRRRADGLRDVNACLLSVH